MNTKRGRRRGSGAVWAAGTNDEREQGAGSRDDGERWSECPIDPINNFKVEISSWILWPGPGPGPHTHTDTRTR